jgi:hypothetical protein
MGDNSMPTMVEMLSYPSNRMFVLARVSRRYRRRYRHRNQTGS